MTYDLRAELTAIHDDELSAADTLPVDLLITRAHRRRMAHTATYSAIGVGAAAAVTVGAIAANGIVSDRDPAPVPPATEEPTPTPRATPTRTPTPTPTPTEAAWEPSWGLCGVSLDDLWGRRDDPGDQGWWLSTPWESTALPLNASSPLDARLYPTLEGELIVDVRVTEAVAVKVDLATNSGQVAGVAAAPVDEATHGATTPQTGLQLAPVDIRLTSCTDSPLTGGGASLDAPLTEGGEYWLMTVTEITNADGTVATGVDFVAYLGELPELHDPAADAKVWWDDRSNWTPEPLSLETPRRLAAGESQTAAGGQDEAFGINELCGKSWPSQWLADWGASSGWHGTAPAGTAEPVSLSATAFRDGGQLVVRVTTTNAGPPFTGTWIRSPGVTVVKDGRIIGWSYDWEAAYEAPPLATGQAVQMEFALGQFTCTFMYGEPWPAGTYEIYVQQNMDILAQSGYAERWQHDAVTGPVTFTLD